MKYRKVYHQINKLLQGDSYSVIVLMGLRKTGKTTILKQLAKENNGHYVDFRNSNNPEQDYLNIYEHKENFILLDEIGYLPNFDALFDTLEVDIKTAKKKVVFTSSSYGALKQLAHERLGGGRSHRIEIFPLDFEEYLYFTDKISEYGYDYEPTEDDIQNFYRLKDVPSGMEFLINKQYMVDTFTDTEVARANHQYAIRDVFLTREQYIAVTDIIAYTLNEHISVKRFTGSQIGVKEFGKDVKGIPISKSLISLANKIVNTMATGIVGSLEFIDLPHIIAYLFASGFLFVDLSVNENIREISDGVLHDLGLVRSLPDFETVLKKYTFSVISPLIYTRLLVDLEGTVGKLYTNESLTGQLYELVIKSEAIYRKGYDLYHDSHKYSLLNIEVDLYDGNLLLEASIIHKKDKEHSVNKVLTDKPLIRVLTDIQGTYEENGTYYRIGYPKALLMMSNGSIFNLSYTKIQSNSFNEMHQFD